MKKDIDLKRTVSSAAMNGTTGPVGNEERSPHTFLQWEHPRSLNSSPTQLPAGALGSSPSFFTKQ